MENLNETWKAVRMYENEYEVSNLGRVRSLAREVVYLNSTPRKYKAKVVKGWNNADGYAMVCLTRSKVKKSKCVHQIMFEAFIGIIPTGHVVDHIDCNKSNNDLSNLRLATSYENLLNRAGDRNAASSYKGVSKHKASGKWRARIGVNKVEISLGYHDTEEEAARAYNTAAKNLHKEFAYQNNI